MTAINLPYGAQSFTLVLPEEEILAVVKANPSGLAPATSAAAVKEALARPIDSPPLGEVVKAGEKICLLVPDITRLWESTFISAPIIARALNGAGIKDEDITVLCATGTHRKMTKEEHERLLGKDLVKRLKIVDHQCGDESGMADMGKTSRGTPVKFNRVAVEADKLISLCGVVYHFLAGFGGGGKMLLPGVAACETIQANHELALLPGMGSGLNPEVRAGNLTASNPFHADIEEAAAMCPPDFSVNVAVNDKFEIIRAFAGNWLTAHAEACRLVAKMDQVDVPRKSGLLIASAGGMPKDINLYQSVKLLSNSMAAAKEGGTIILLAQCGEGFGNEDTARQIKDMKSMEQREKALRGSFSIGAFAGFLCAEASEKYNIILVSDMAPADYANTKIHAVATLDEALAKTRELNGGKLPDAAIVMPHGATTLPRPIKQ